ncbi:MAG: acyl-CoA dehydrogenase C-terminal domain-containing protein, partial [Maricaulaceae bacterium]
PIGERLDAAIKALEKATAFMIDAQTPLADRLAGATAYTMLAGDVIGGYYLGVGAVAGQRMLKENAEDEYAQSKVDLARFYAETVLSTIPGRIDAVTVGADALFDVPEEMLG